MDRIVEVNLGDWSHDGHGLTEKFLVKLYGDDVSDAVLAANYTATAELLGKDLRDVCASYDEDRISVEYVDALFEHGFDYNRDEEIWPSIYIRDAVDPNPIDPEDEGETGVEFGAIELLMFYVGRTIPNFSWHFVGADHPVLLGGYGTIITQNQHSVSTSFGYGLYTQ